MTKSYFGHFGTVIFIHAWALVGTWEVSQTNVVKTAVAKLGNGALSIQVTGNLAARSIPLQMKTPPVQKKVAKNVAKKMSPPKPKAEAQPEVQAQTASSGTAGTPGVANGSEFGNAARGATDVLSVYKAELRSVIDKNKYYPTLSKRLGHTGTVVVAFTLKEDGHIIDVRIDSPSRYEGLNHSALDAVKKIEQFKPIPKELGMAEMDVKVPVKFLTI